MKNKIEQVGHRLQYMELLNWGTFNNKIWKITPEGENSLLTGAVGSGKSTVVDALTCLLVPYNRITFNKAAGAESKERNLASYIKGNYSSKSDELTNGSKAVSLRYIKAGEATFTVIIANFYNEGYNIHTSLAQLFWIENNSNVRKLLLIGSEPLSIKEHFSGFTDIKELKRRLRTNNHIEIFDDNFSRYSQRFRQLFGMNSDKAIELFYQTVSMKSVSSLTSFVREQMLEPTNIQEQIEELKKRFDNLHQAHAAVMEARKQRDILNPLTELDHDYSQTEELLHEIEVLLSDVIPSTEQTFYRNLKSTEEKQEEMRKEREKLTTLQGSRIAEHLNTEQEIEIQKSEIESLQTRSNQLPSGILEIRKQLVEHLGICEEELPFVGELLQVRSEDKEWEGALERLLRGFGISMLVPDRYYHIVSGFINANKLQDNRHKGIRLEYFRIPEESKQYNTLVEDLSPSSAVNKINIKSNTPFHNWLEKELVRRFNLQCVSLNEFQNVSDGITKEGQIKTGRLRHVKDDRRDLWDRRNFILGWSNKEKIQAIQAYLKSLLSRYEIEKNEIKEKSKAIDLCNATLSSLMQIKRFQDWNELNWQQETEHISHLQKEKQELSESNNLIKTLAEQQKQMEYKESELRNHIDKLKDNRGRLNNQIETAHNQLPELQLQSIVCSPEDKSIFYSKIESAQPDTSYTLGNIDNLKAELSKSLSGKRLNIQKKRDTTREKITQIMRDYRNAFPFDALELPEDIEARKEYLKILQQVVKEGLPAHEAKSPIKSGYNKKHCYLRQQT